MNMSLAPFVRILGQASRKDLVLLSVLLLVASLTEGIGLLLVVPMIAWLTGDKAGGGQHEWLQWLSGAGLPITLAGLLCVFVLLIAMRSLIELARDRVQADVQFRLVDKMRALAFQGVLGAEWRWLVGTRRSHHANQLLVDVNRIGLAVGFGIGFIVTLVTIAAYLVVALLLSPTMTGLAVLAGILILMPLAGLRKRAVLLGDELTKANRALHSAVDEGLMAVKLAKLHDREAWHLAQIKRMSVQLRQRQLAFQIHSGAIRAIFQTAGAAVLACYLYFGLAHGHVPLPQLLTLTLIYARLVPILITAQRQFHSLLHGLPAVQATEKLLADCRTAAEPKGPDTLPLPPQPRGAIELEGVSVVYPGAPPALDDVSLSLPLGTTTAVYGHSGAGKSTLADSLVGLIVPDSGLIRVAGHPIAPEERQAWRRQVAYVPQDCTLFHDSIRRNLLWAMPDATEADLRNALHRAAADFVHALPEGMDTIVGDAGCRLSGGERQRLGLARGLLRDPLLLVLDEATSALDPKTEARIFETLETLRGQLTILVIGHRLPRFDFADQVVRLEAGRIVERFNPASEEQVATLS